MAEPVKMPIYSSVIVKYRIQVGSIVSLAIMKFHKLMKLYTLHSSFRTRRLVPKTLIEVVERKRKESIQKNK